MDETQVPTLTASESVEKANLSITFEELPPWQYPWVAPFCEELLQAQVAGVADVTPL